jgi:hypothetical protein
MPIILSKRVQHASAKGIYRLVLGDTAGRHLNAARRRAARCFYRARRGRGPRDRAIVPAGGAPRWPTTRISPEYGRDLLPKKPVSFRPPKFGDGVEGKTRAGCPKTASAADRATPASATAIFIDSVLAVSARVPLVGVVWGVDGASARVWLLMFS